MVILQTCAARRKYLLSLEHPRHQLQAGAVYMQEGSISGQSGDLTSSDESFCLQVKIQCTQANCKIPTPHHLITNLVYRLKPHITEEFST